MKKLLTLFLAGTALAFQSQAQTVLPIGDMEVWHNYSSGFPPTALEAPQGWKGLDSVIAQYAILLQTTAKKQLFKTTDAHGGTNAARLLSRTYGAPLNTLPGVMSNANISIDINNMTYKLSGGTPVTQRFTDARAWIKYHPKNTTDSGILAVQAVLAGQGAGGADSVVGVGAFVVGGTINTYTQITAHMTYVNPTVVPDHIQVGLISAANNNGADSTELLVDDVSIIAANGISQVLFHADVVHCYPNPTSNFIHLSTDETEALTWEAVATTGQLIASKEFTKAATVPLQGIPAGIYFYRVLNKNREMIQTGKFTVQ